MNEEEIKEREQLRQFVLHAKTLDEVKEARKRLSSWLKRHPDDKQLLGEGESLVMLEKALMNMKNGHS
jgi:hypothetical protein